jgi:hypothetical protein
MIALEVYRQTMTKDLKMFNSDTTAVENIRNNVGTIKQVFANVYNDLVSIEVSMGDQISSAQLFIIAALKERSHYLKAKINGYEKKIFLLLDQGQEYLQFPSNIDFTSELKNIEEEVNAFLARVLILFTLFEPSPVSINLQ